MTKYDGREGGLLLIAQKGRAYQQGSRYITVHVFTTYKVEAVNLVLQFGGNFYPHKGGYLWICGRWDDVLQFIAELRVLLGKDEEQDKKLALIFERYDAEKPLMDALAGRIEPTTSTGPLRSSDLSLRSSGT
jgi:hypothetical protein